MALQLRDSWTASYVNDLPDSAFLLITPGGTKDSSGKTVPRTNRYFPVYGSDGKVDEPHVANALARIPQASSLTPSQRAAAMTKAKALAAKTNVSGDVGEYTGSAGSGRSKELLPETMMGLQTRSFDIALELRADSDGRTLIGRAVPYGVTTQIDSGRASERFILGAFARQISSGHLGAVKMFDSHSARLQGQQPIGATAELNERTDGLWGAWPLYKTNRADDALELVRAGAVTGLSVGFKALDGGTRRGGDGAFERHQAHLDHIVLTHEPAYADAAVTAIRTSSHPAGHGRADKTFLLQAHRILDRVNEPE